MNKHNHKIKQTVKEIATEFLAETSRKQKAVSNLNGQYNRIKTMAILTSESPRYSISQNFDVKNNIEKQNSFERKLVTGHYAWFPVKGQYEDKESSYIIYNISLDNALYLARESDQKSIIYIEGEHCQYWEQSGDGKYRMTHERDMHQRLDMSDADDYYIQVSRAFKFQIPFFDGSDENKEMMNESIRYVNRVIDSRVKDLNEAERRIETTINAKSGYNRFCDRAELYGNNFNRKCSE